MEFKEVHGTWLHFQELEVGVLGLSRVEWRSTKSHDEEQDAKRKDVCGLS